MERRINRGDRWPFAVGRWPGLTSANGPRRTANEEGFTLAAVLVLLSLMMIVVAYTVPRQWSAVLQRDRERRTIDAMHQYARACREWSNAHGNTYPVNPTQLKEARSPRFIRGPKSELVDPLTGEVDWLVIPQAAAAALQGGGGQQQPNQMPTPQNPQQKPSLPGIPMKDYAGGSFVGVRPPVTGKAMLSVNGNDTYETWMYTALDLDNDIKRRMAGLAIVYK